MLEATYMGVAGSSGSFGGGSGLIGTGNAADQSLPKMKRRKRLRVVTRVTEGVQSMYLTQNPVSLVEQHSAGFLIESHSDSSQKIEEAALYVNKADIGKINGLFPMKFQARFGFPPIFKHDIDNRMIINSLPSEKIMEIVDFFKSFGCDVQIAP